MKYTRGYVIKSADLFNYINIIKKETLAKLLNEGLNHSALLDFWINIYKHSKSESIVELYWINNFQNLLSDCSSLKSLKEYFSENEHKGYCFSVPFNDTNMIGKQFNLSHIHKSLLNWWFYSIEDWLFSITLLHKYWNELFYSIDLVQNSDTFEEFMGNKYLTTLRDSNKDSISQVKGANWSVKKESIAKKYLSIKPLFDIEEEIVKYKKDLAKINNTNPIKRDNAKDIKEKDRIISNYIHLFPGDNVAEYLNGVIKEKEDFLLTISKRYPKEISDLIWNKKEFLNRIKEFWSFDVFISKILLRLFNKDLNNRKQFELNKNYFDEFITIETIWDEIVEYLK